MLPRHPPRKESAALWNDAGNSYWNDARVVAVLQLSCYLKMAQMCGKACTTHTLGFAPLPPTRPPHSAHASHENKAAHAARLVPPHRVALVVCHSHAPKCRLCHHFRSSYRTRPASSSPGKFLLNSLARASADATEHPRDRSAEPWDVASTRIVVSQWKRSPLAAAEWVFCPTSHCWPSETRGARRC